MNPQIYILGYKTVFIQTTFTDHTAVLCLLLEKKQSHKSANANPCEWKEKSGIKPMWFETKTSII